jgi:hypothetical protein
MNYDNLDEKSAEEARERANKEFKEQMERDIAKRTKEKDMEKGGHKAEREVLGEIKVDGYQRFVKRKMEGFGEKKPDEKVMFQIYRNAVKENQKTFDNPSDPREKKFPSDFHSGIVEMLSKQLKESGEDKGMEYEQLRYYTCVGTAGSDLDTAYGTDAFLELDLGDGKTVDLKLDFTLKPEHQTRSKYKADMVIGEWEGKKWFDIPYENTNIDDPEDVAKEKMRNRRLYEERTMAFVKLAVEILNNKAKDAGRPITILEKDEITQSKDKSFNQLERQVGRVKGSAGLHRNLQMGRMKKRI